MSAAQLLKSLIKGTDISEDAVLDKYLMSRGINPKFATKDQKVSHSKTGAFITWKNSRMIEDTLEERVDKKDSVTLDIPLLIRIMELAREDIKTDMDLHRVVEKLINIRNKGMLTMKDYNYIAKIHEEIMSQVSQEVIDEVSLGDYKEKATQQVKELKPHTKGEYSGIAKRMLQRREKGLKMASTREEVEPIDEITTTGYHKAAVKSRMDAAVKVASSMGKDKAAKTKLDARNKGLNRLSDRTSAEMKKANSGPQKPREAKTPSDAEQRGYGQGRYMGDSVEHQDETMVEAQSAAVRWQKALEAAKKKREDEATRNAENAKRALTPVKEDKFQDSMAATQTVGMEVDNPSDADRKSQMSKSARIIKSIYKRKNMKEDLYDHEKDDKPAATYGKKPKMSVTKPTDNVGENKPDAAAILTGGKTLTGQTRDTIEIDPMMKKRPGSDPTGKNK